MCDPFNFEGALSWPAHRHLYQPWIDKRRHAARQPSQLTLGLFFLIFLYHVETLLPLKASKQVEYLHCGLQFQPSPAAFATSWQGRVFCGHGRELPRLARPHCTSLRTWAEAWVRMLSSNDIRHRLCAISTLWTWAGRVWSVANQVRLLPTIMWITNGILGPKYYINQLFAVS